MAEDLDVRIGELALKYLPLAKEILKGAIAAPLPYVEKGDLNCGLSAGWFRVTIHIFQFFFNLYLSQEKNLVWTT